MAIFWANLPTVIREALYSDILREAANECGRDGANISGDEQLVFRGFISRGIREVWEGSAFWPDIMDVERRGARQKWVSGVAYASGDEVWHATTTVDRHYVANATTTAGEEPGVSSKWDTLTITRFKIDYDQTNENHIASIKTVTSKDPRESNSGTPYDPRLDSDAITLIPGTTLPDSVWVDFRRKTPVFQGSNFSSASIPADGTVVYDATADRFGEIVTWKDTDGTDLYPASTTASERIYYYYIPHRFRSFLIHYAASAMYMQDEKPALAGAQMSLANKDLDRQVVEFMRETGNQHPVRVKGY